MLFSPRISITVLALALALAPTLSLAAAVETSTAQVRGTLLTKEGLPAAAHQIGLKSSTGDLFLSPPTGPDGSFAIELLPPGKYELVALSPDGAQFPVLGRQVELKAGQVERVELRLSDEEIAPGRTDEELASTRDATSSRKRAGFFQSRTGRIVLVAGGIFAAALIVSALDDDDDDEPAASPAAP
ncbi:MAG: carboxypeptidase regulatory-like domain-containing protein [Acidobacteria bacterium]|nr:carboxypeptidase regulatory-like domain-containing protein [Acidobacteriota bacterium]